MASLAAAADLADVDLSGNKLTGMLPGLPAGLQTMDASRNAFSGGIPEAYGAPIKYMPINVGYDT